jgi:hypothetical protein
MMMMMTTMTTTMIMPVTVRNLSRQYVQIDFGAHTTSCPIQDWPPGARTANGTALCH